MKKRYARAKPIKKENKEEEPTIIELDIFKLSMLIGTLIYTFVL